VNETLQLKNIEILRLVQEQFEDNNTARNRYLVMSYDIETFVAVGVVVGMAAILYLTKKPNEQVSDQTQQLEETQRQRRRYFIQRQQQEQERQQQERRQQKQEPPTVQVVIPGHADEHGWTTIPTVTDRVKISIRYLAENVRFRIYSNRTPLPYRWTGHGRFVCQCGHRWTSYQLQTEIDWQLLRAEKISRQKCERCDTINSPTAIHDFDDWIIRLLKKLASAHARRTPNDEHKEGPPHRSNLCEACGFGPGNICGRRYD
jgi:hypothetical protein